MSNSKAIIGPKKRQLKIFCDYFRRFFREISYGVRLTKKSHNWEEDFNARAFFIDSIKKCPCIQKFVFMAFLGHFSEKVILHIKLSSEHFYSKFDPKTRACYR